MDNEHTDSINWTNETSKTKRFYELNQRMSNRLMSNNNKLTEAMDHSAKFSVACEYFGHLMLRIGLQPRNKIYAIQLFTLY